MQKSLMLVGLILALASVTIDCGGGNSNEADTSKAIPGASGTPGQVGVPSAPSNSDQGDAQPSFPSPASFVVEGAIVLQSSGRLYAVVRNPNDFAAVWSGYSFTIIDGGGNNVAQIDFSDAFGNMFYEIGDRRIGIDPRSNIWIIGAPVEPQSTGLFTIQMLGADPSWSIEANSLEIHAIESRIPSAALRVGSVVTEVVTDQGHDVLAVSFDVTNESTTLHENVLASCGYYTAGSLVDISTSLRAATIAPGESTRLECLPPPLGDPSAIDDVQVWTSSTTQREYLQLEMEQRLRD